MLGAWVTSLLMGHEVDSIKVAKAMVFRQKRCKLGQAGDANKTSTEQKVHHLLQATHLQLCRHGNRIATSCGTDNDIRASRQTWASVKLQKKGDTLPAQQLERSIRLR
jgi:hypothetical protein